MTKANRIKLGKEWKRRILENKKLPNDKQLKVPKGITLNHPYILEAGKKSKSPAAKVSKKEEGVPDPKPSKDDEGSKLADSIMKGDQ